MGVGCAVAAVKTPPPPPPLSSSRVRGDAASSSASSSASAAAAAARLAPIRANVGAAAASQLVLHEGPSPRLRQVTSTASMRLRAVNGRRSAFCPVAALDSARAVGEAVRAPHLRSSAARSERGAVEKPPP